MENGQSAGNVDRLLQELLEKRNWLDTVIRGIEAAEKSPQYRLIQEASEALEEDWGSPMVDLSKELKRRLSDLAKQVPIAKGGARAAEDVSLVSRVSTAPGSSG